MSNSNIFADRNDTKKFFRQAILFVLVGLVLYVILYAAADQLVYRYAKRNRFFMVNTAPIRDYDHVFLGASHAVVFDYEDMNARLEQMTGSQILNLSAVGSGVVVNRLMLDYFLANHQTKNVVYFVDSFAFYTPEWNEKRFQDVRLFDRAPFDPSLFLILFQNLDSRWLSWDYLSGFAKINNADRFKPDITEDEATKFAKTYRPLAQIDKQRIEYLYPSELDPADFRRYLGEFENMIQFLKHHNIRLTVIKPPIPTRIYKMLPNETEFDQALKTILDRNGIAFHDFSLVSNEEKFFFNPDHLNRDGVLNFYDKNLKQVLTR
ncbi:MAG: hypothetical protein HZB51_12920 [Chloroflexi bacterium]|nr:hypothetical protein [Chloroflexota bacterium]